MIRVLTLSTIIILLLSSCGKDSSSEPETLDIGSPPTLTQLDATKTLEVDQVEAEQLKLETYLVSDDTFQMEIDAPGTVYASPEYYAIVSTPLSGRVSAIYGHEGEAVNKGEPIIELESLDYAALIGDFIEAVSEKKYAQAQSNRLKSLSEDKISSEQEYIRAQTDLNRIQARLMSLKASISALGVSDRIIQKWETEPDSIPQKLVIRAPISGKINRHEIDLGEPVKAFQLMLDIINLDEVMVKGYPNPDDISLIQIDDSVFIYRKLMQANNANYVTAGSIMAINPALDDNNRSAVTNSYIGNTSRALIPGEQVSLKYYADAVYGLRRIPMSSISYDGNQPGVFVQLSERVFELRPIEIYRMTEDWVIVSDGLETGDHVVTNQIFSLKAMLRFEKFAD